MELASQNRFLLCLSDSAREMWRKNLGQYHPHQFLFYKDKIVVHDCGFTGRGYINACYIFDRNGIQLWEYKTHSRDSRDWDVRLNHQEGILMITDRAIQKAVKLDTLSLKTF
jgi:outer membrane protein assembly factor BamB